MTADNIKSLVDGWTFEVLLKAERARQGYYKRIFQSYDGFNWSVYLDTVAAIRLVDPVEKPWYPDGSRDWVETAGYTEADLCVMLEGKKFEALERGERETKTYLKHVYTNWNAPYWNESAGPIQNVAFKVVV